MPSKKPLSFEQAVRAITSTPRRTSEPKEQPKSQPADGPAKVFEDQETPGRWRVEWVDDDGRCELEVFAGPTARRQALRYAMQKYGHFREVQLEPYRQE
jgi:hypothetical protein